MNTEKQAGDEPEAQKNEVMRLFAQGEIDPNRATARLLEVDRRCRGGAREKRPARR